MNKYRMTYKWSFIFYPITFTFVIEIIYIYIYIYVKMSIADPDVREGGRKMREEWVRVGRTVKREKVFFFLKKVLNDFNITKTKEI